MNIIQSSILGLALLCPLTTAPLAEAAPVTRTLVREGEGIVPQPTRVLLTGDSLMASLGPQMKRALDGYENLTLIPIGKGSTGLARPDFYNWPEVLEKNLIEHKPHIVVMWIGTNDTQNIYGMKGLGEPLSHAWQKAYYNKLVEIINLVRRYNAKLIFMSPPVMDKQPFDSKLNSITTLMAWTCKKGKVGFINTRPILADDKCKYVHRKTMPTGETADIRTPDHIHITANGNNLVMEKLLPMLSSALPGAKIRKTMNIPPYRLGATGSSKTSRGIRGASVPRSPRAFNKSVSY